MIATRSPFVSPRACNQAAKRLDISSISPNVIVLPKPTYALRVRYFGEGFLQQLHQ